MRSPGAIKILVAVLALAAVTIAAGCGSSSDETTGASETPAGARAKSCGGSGGDVRVSGASCALGRLLVAAWHKDDACSSPAGASRTSCRLGTFVCLGTATDRGLAVSCAGSGRSISFLAKPR